MYEFRFNILGYNKGLYMKAQWNNKVVAESQDTILLENNHYFPEEAAAKFYLVASNTTSHCAWKGEAHYYHLVVDGETNKDAAWYYPEPYEAAKEIAGRIAFWRGVKVS